MARIVLGAGQHSYSHFAAYPMAQVLMWRWGSHRSGTWKISFFIGIGFEFADRLGIMDDFGNLVEVPHG